jgi:WD40 repeat protein
VWDAASGQELLTLKGHTDKVCSVAFSPDGQRILTGSWDNTAKVWEAASGRELLTLKGHCGEVESVAFSADGRRILTGSWDGTAKVWEAVRGSGPLTLNGHSDEVFSVAFSPDGQRILTGSFDGTAKVWEAASGRELLTFTNQTVEIHSDEFTPYPKGHVARFISVAFSPDGQRIVTGSTDGLAKVWEAASGRALHTLKGHADWVISAAFSPDGQRIVTGSDDRTAKVWDAASGKELLTLKGHSIGVASVAFSPDGQRIVTGSRDGTAKVWETASGTELFTLKGHTDTVFSVAFSPDGQRIVTGSHDYTAKIWNAANGQEINTLNGHRSMVYSVAFSPDGRRIVTGSDDSTAKVWEAASGRELLTLTGHSGGVVSVAFSPDGQRIVTGSRDHTARVWQAARPEQVAAWRREEKAATEHLAALRQVQEGEGQAFALNSQGKLSEAEALFRQTIDAARKANDGDDLPNVLAGLGDLLRDQGKTAQAEPLYREGLALCRKVSPENCEQRQWLASVLALTLRNEGKMAEVEALYLEAITNSAKLWPQNFPRWEWQYNGLMDVLQHEGKTNEVERLGQEFSAYANAGLLPPPIFKTGEEGLLYSSGMLHARAGQWTNAVAEFSKLVEMDPNEHWYHYHLAPLLAQSGDLKGYRRHCAQVLAIFGGTNNPIVAERMAKDCLMVPAAGIDLDAVARLADTAVMKGNGHQYFAYFEFVKGLAEYRQQHFASAIDWTQKALADPSVNYRNAQAYLVLAMAQHESGKLPECRVALDKGDQIIEAMPKLESGDIGETWNDWIIVHLLRNEAKAMIGSQPAKAGQNSSARRD